MDPLNPLNQETSTLSTVLASYSRPSHSNLWHTTFCVLAFWRLPSPPAWGDVRLIPSACGDGADRSRSSECAKAAWNRVESASRALSSTQARARDAINHDLTGDSRARRFVTCWFSDDLAPVLCTRTVLSPDCLVWVETMRIDNVHALLPNGVQILKYLLRNQSS